jgi:Xaa-Pro aminopeptidase
MPHMTDARLYRQRRECLLQQMQLGIAVIPTAEEVERNGDTHYAYRHDSNFYYLTGFTEPEAVLVLIAAGSESRSILFCRRKDLEREIWDGHRLGPEAAVEELGLDVAYPIEELDERLETLLGNQPTLFYPLGANPTWDERLFELRRRVQSKIRSGIRAPERLHDIRGMLHDMRLRKDAHEKDILRRAAQISAQAHKRAMRTVRAGMFEYEIEAELLHEFCRHGARHPAYPTIVAAGANACVLHYVANHSRLRDNDLLLIDAGCEIEGYAADITRTFPVSGRFSGTQKAVYEVVLAAQMEAIAHARIGHTWDEPHQAALRVLAQGFIDLKLCHGSVDSVLESESYKRFYMHRTGHWLGMDVHDVGDYKVDDHWRQFESGMTLTVEPGCYIRPADDVPLAFWNIGIRIEDDVLITAEGNEVLTDATPKSINDIEEWIRHD